MISENYTEKCDVWSLGVMAYVLLTGVPPFDGETDEDIMERVKSGKFTFNVPEMAKVSSEAKDLISKMLVMDPNDRISAKKALDHPWFQNNTSPKILVESRFSKLSRFQFTSKLQEIVSFYICNNMLSAEEKGKIMEVFRDLDSDHDGKLSKSELKKGLKRLKDFNLADVDLLMETYDNDGNGYIDYSGKKRLMLRVLDCSNGQSEDIDAVEDRQLFRHLRFERRWPHIFARVEVSNNGCSFCG